MCMISDGNAQQPQGIMRSSLLGDVSFGRRRLASTSGEAEWNSGEAEWKPGVILMTVAGLPVEP